MITTVGTVIEGAAGQSIPTVEGTQRLADRPRGRTRLAQVRTLHNVLYMAALSASRYSPALKTFHNRLVAADKKSKVIIVAIMRK